MSDADWEILETSDVSLLETLDHVLNRGIVITGNITISVADIDLVYLGLDVLVGSVETIKQVLQRSVTDLPGSASRTAGTAEPAGSEDGL